MCRYERNDPNHRYVIFQGYPGLLLHVRTFLDVFEREKLHYYWWLLHLTEGRVENRVSFLGQKDCFKVAHLKIAYGVDSTKGRSIQMFEKSSYWNKKCDDGLEL